MDNKTSGSLDPVDENAPAIVGLGLVIVAVSLVFLAIPLDRLIPPHDFLPEHVRMFAVYNSIRQRAVHGVWALLTVLTCLTILYGPKSLLGFVRFPHDRWRAFSWLMPIMSVAAIICTVRSDPGSYDRRVAYIGFPLLLIAALLLQPIARAARTLPDRYLWCALAALLGLFLIPGFFVTVALDTNYLVQVDYHYSVVLGSVQLLRDPSIDPQLISFYYGFLSAFSAARLGDLFRINSFGGYVHLIQGYQVIFAVLLMVSAYVFSRRNKYFLLLMSVLAVPWVSTMSPSIWAPNQSGWRMMMFPLLPLMIIVVRSMQGSVLRMVLTVVFSSAAVLWNFETGIAVSAAIIATALLCEYRNGRSVVALISIAFFAILGTILMLSLGHRILVGGEWLWLGLPRYLTGIVEGGPSGLKHQNDFFAVGLSVLTTIILIRGCASARNGTLTDEALGRSAICVAILVWFAYYANRPAPWNLWTLFVLGLFVIEPVTRREFWAKRVDKFPRSIGQPTTFLALIVVIFIPLIALANYNRSIRSFKFAANLQGLNVPSSIAELESEKANTFSNSPGRTIYFSAVPSMTGFMTGKHNPSLPFDPFGETYTTTQFEELIGRVNAVKPDRIFIELQSSPLLQVSEPRQAFFARLRTALASRFVSKGETGGWEIWEPNSAPLSHSAVR